MNLPQPDECRICHRPKEDHLNFRHEFVPADGSSILLEKLADDALPASGDPSTQVKIRSIPGGDPVLRMALIRAGIITTADLSAVEEELRATGVAGYDASNSVG